ncbi:MAG: MarR family winged helix-turn-helix transcriptional regulator [Eubacteriales bacterium]|jgi:MarR family transcriptional regulator for hemolysin
MVYTSLMKFISRISRCSDQYRADRLAGTELTSSQYVYILNVCREPGISQDGLAKKIFVNKSNVARQLAALESSGYVNRITSVADRRGIEVYPTEKSEKILPFIRGMLRDWDSYLTEGFTDEEKETVARLLGIMHDRAAEYMENRCCEPDSGGKA